MCCSTSGGIHVTWTTTNTRETLGLLCDMRPPSDTFVSDAQCRPKYSIASHISRVAGVPNPMQHDLCAWARHDQLTLHRLNVFPELGVSFRPTDLIENVMARLAARTRRVTRWRTSDQKLRWCASALWAMERQFRRVKQYWQLFLLKRALQARLSLTTTATA